MGKIKTLCLMGGLIVIFMFVGNILGGAEGMRVAFWAALGMNFFSYFYSDKMVLKHYKAVEIKENSSSPLYSIVKHLAQQANLPMPKVYIIPEDVPNAFATGRNPSHAAVAATQGLLDLLSLEEIEGVLAHEMSHVRHYDILISSVAAMFASAIAFLGNLARSGTASSSQRRSNPLSTIIAALLMPIAASIVQMSISRTREYAADEGAARLTRHPEWLMSALSKLDHFAKNNQMQRATSQTAHMFIINPFSGTSHNFSNLFATHPSTADRLARLEQLKQQIS
ncbi:MAG: zinc metalloprotease HtpX [Alphaproteobacteria bacterium]|nr:zinc metalloprotease HtpX [Alphaproteobacteria bacterium]